MCVLETVAERSSKTNYTEELRYVPKNSKHIIVQQQLYCLTHLLPITSVSNRSVTLSVWIPQC